MRITLAFLLLVNVAAAQDDEPVPAPDDGLPRAVVHALTEVEPGDLLKFDASESVGDHYLWMVDFTGGSTSPDTKQQRIREAITLLEGERFTIIAPAGSSAKDYDTDSGGKIIWVPSKAGRHYSVNFVVSNAKGIHGTLARARVLGGTPPPPPPPPPPDGPPPPPPPPGGPNLDLSAQAAQWITLVPANVRGEVFKHPISEDTMTRQQAIGRTFREVGSIAAQIGSFEGIEIILSTGLAAGYMPNDEVWRPFTDKANAALEALIAQRVTFAQYGQALQSIGAALE